MLGIKLSDLDEPPRKGDELTVNEINYRVIDSREDGRRWEPSHLA